MPRMRPTAHLVAALALLPSLAGAAEVTRVASSFDPDRPFGFHLDVGWSHLRDRTKLVREAYQDGDSVDVAELSYERTQDRIAGELHVGLFRDLEFRAQVPFILRMDQSWGYPAGTNAENSTLFNNCVAPGGQLLDPGCAANGTGAAPVYAVPANSYRGGLGNLSFGLAWAALQQRRDDAGPTWILAFDYEAPTATRWVPELSASQDARGGVGDKVHHLTFSTAFSRKLGAAEPYFRLHYTLPVSAADAFDNCEHPDKLGAPQNCTTGDWSKAETSLSAPHRAGFTAGAELIPWEDVKAQQKFALDVRTDVTWFSPGRYHGPLTDLGGKLFKSQDFVKLNGQLGVVLHAGRYFQLTGGASFAYTTEHTVTDEAIGKDLPEPNGPPNGTVDVVSNPRELNPSFDWRVDLVGRRLRATEATTLGFFLRGTLGY
ncbi:MAG: hypothetical protein RL653_4008 [Pseudomonadota bacterium]